MRRPNILLATLVVGLLVGIPVDPASSQPITTESLDFTPFPTGAFVVLQPAILKAGDQRVFRIESNIASTIPGGTAPERSVRTVRIEVVNLRAGKARLAQTTLTYEGAAFPRLAQALIGRRMEYEADGSGHPATFGRWPKYRKEIISALESNGDRDLARFIQPLSDSAALPFILADAAMIGAMQSPKWRGQSRVEDPVKTPAPGVRVTSYSEVLGYRASGCAFGYRRVSELDPNSPHAISTTDSEHLSTLATVSMVDGWIVSLKETALRSRGGGKESVERVVTRVPPPGGACRFNSSPVAPSR